jgi:photosystem II stability/assembly factor-like uncharacterized protein
VIADGPRTAGWLARGGVRSQQVGVAVGEQGAIFKTADSGNTWRQIQTGTERNLNAIQFINHQTAFAVGDGGTILRSDDTGESWRAVASPVGVNLRGITIVDSSSAGLLAVGIIVGDTDVVLRSEDQGVTWNQVDVSGARDQLYSVNFPIRASATSAEPGASCRPPTTV